MKKIIIIVFMAFAAFSCNKPVKVATFSGNIDNAVNDSVYLTSNDYRKAFALNDGAFSDTLKIDAPGYYKFFSDKEYTWVYLQPGDELSLSTNMHDFDNKLTYSGVRSEENNFIAKKMNKEIHMTGDPFEFFSVDAQTFKQNLENYRDEMLAELENSKTSNEFKALEKKNLQFNYYSYLAKYPDAHNYFTKANIELPKEFAAELDGIDTDNEEDFLNIPEYNDYIMYLNTVELSKIKTGDEIVAILDGIKSGKIRDGVIRNFLIYQIGSGAPYAQQLNEYIQNRSADEGLKKLAAANFEKIEKLIPGKPSPKFAYPDIDGNTVALDDLKGNLVYIDVWATWCVPCLQEIPSLKQLESDYEDKDVHFVSMSIDQKRDFEKWQNMVREKELQGIQIFADNDWKSQFVQDYNINGIPRFILLDKEGNIINANAPRPSNPEIRTLLDENI